MTDNFWHKWWAIIVTLVLFFLLSLGGALYAFAHEGKIYPGVAAASFPLGGLTPEQAEKTLDSALAQLRDNGLLFVYGSRQVSVPMVAPTTADPDLSYGIIDYNSQNIIKQAYAFGRGKSFWRNWQERLTSLFDKKKLDIDYTWREDKALQIIKSNFADLENPGKDAGLRIAAGAASILPEEEGYSFDYQKALKEARVQLSSLVFRPINLELKLDRPQVRFAEAQFLLPEIQKLAEPADKIEICPSQECAGSEKRESPRQEILALLQFRKDEAGRVTLGFAPEKFALWLEPIGLAINISPQEPRFKVENNRVVEFAAASPGKNLDLEKTRSSWEQDFIQERKNRLYLTIEETPAFGRVADLNSLGINEILGVGYSSFAGSPRNRRHNIKVGADALDGILIAPGEEFSLLKALGNIDAKAGYLPELVIKGNKTIPEYGGGLCQIGTTTFRATLATALPVTARRNHSYAVTYYNDALGRPGTDATIYDPAPDYRFKNDTANYILIQTRIEGDDLYFEFWGTGDGRKMEQSETRVWDRVGPGPTKFIETLDLKPGEKKCTERPHAGVKAAFDYKIIYPDGREDATTFSSTYRPWQEVCLIGVEKLSEEPTTQLNTDDASASVGNVQ